MNKGLSKQALVVIKNQATTSSQQNNNSSSSNVMANIQAPMSLNGSTVISGRNKTGHNEITEAQRKAEEMDELQRMEEDVMSELRQNEYLNDQLKAQAIDKNFNQMLNALNNRLGNLAATANSRADYCRG